MYSKSSLSRGVYSRDLWAVETQEIRTSCYVGFKVVSRDGSTDSSLGMALRNVGDIFSSREQLLELECVNIRKSIFSNCMSSRLSLPSLFRGSLNDLLHFSFYFLLNFLLFFIKLFLSFIPPSGLGVLHINELYIEVAHSTNSQKVVCLYNI